MSPGLSSERPISTRTAMTTHQSESQRAASCNRALTGPSNSNHAAYPFLQPTRFLHEPVLRQHRGLSRGRYSRPRQPASELESDPEAQWKNLWARVESCEGYRKYRERLAKGENDGDEKKWPDHLEQVFFRALLKYPPMGRGKQLHKEKQHGRNELISDYIEELTGERRCRKQISSHIQVLKSFFMHDPSIMKHFSSKDLRGRSIKRQSSRHSPSISRQLITSGSVDGSPLHMQAMPPAFMPWQPRLVDEHKGDLDLFRPVDLQMFLQKKHIGLDGREGSERLHTYTMSSYGSWEDSVQIGSWEEVREEYPILAEQNFQQHFNCNVIAAEAALVLPAETFNEAIRSTSGMEVGISYLCSSKYLREPGIMIRCHNNLYIDGMRLEDPNGGSESEHLMQPSIHMDAYEAYINFHSRFWADTLGSVGQQLSTTQDTVPMDVYEAADTDLRSITMVQEIFAQVEGRLERILVIHWSFCLSTEPVGRTTWRLIDLPVTPARPWYFMRENSAQGSFRRSPSYSVPNQSLEHEFGFASDDSPAAWSTSLSDYDALEAAGNPVVTISHASHTSEPANAYPDPTLTFPRFPDSPFLLTPPVDNFSLSNPVSSCSTSWYGSYTDSLESYPKEQNEEGLGLETNGQEQQPGVFVDLDELYQRNEFFDGNVAHPHSNVIQESMN